MTILKNPRHEKFAREYVKTGIGAEAYRRAYPRAHPISTARVCASQLLTKPNIVSRTAELRQAMAKRADITEDKILTDYQDALDLAKTQEKPDSIVNAATAQAKLVGLYKDRIETSNVDDIEKMDKISDILQAVADRAGPEAASALAKAFGLDESAMDD
jgi:phage terminase small subunit